MTLAILSTSPLLLREAAHLATTEYLSDLVAMGTLTDREALELGDLSLSYYLTEATCPCRLRMYKGAGDGR